jgi:hypothetical protein
MNLWDSNVAFLNLGAPPAAVLVRPAGPALAGALRRALGCPT